MSLGIPEHLQVVSGEERSVHGADLRRALARRAHGDRLVGVLCFYLDMPVEEVASVVCAVFQSWISPPPTRTAATTTDPVLCMAMAAL